MTVVLGATLILGVGALVWRGGPAATPAGSTRDAGVDPAMVLGPPLPPEGGLLDDPFLARLLASPDAGPVDEGAADAPVGRALPVGAPKLVRFGVILVQYRGAEGAPPSSRSRDDAAALARTVADAAKLDFKSQISRGDPGSLEDAGRIPRGVLEPTIEYALFTMAKGDVSDPLDTPRGFWIVKRID